ncbi:MAG: BamA/TamA family outer membrane protein [Saprospiraceae bacterium]|nr:BamA/TamA family outer membrane protein [Saprospiraceae bacterium]
MLIFNTKTIYFFAFAILCVILSSCNATKYLSPGESLLKETKILFKSGKPIKDKSSLEAELMTFVNQKPNEKLLFFIPKEWIYLKNNQPGDTSWFNTGLKGLGEPPSIYNEALTLKTVQDMENYLLFKKGYYEAKVDYLLDEKRKNRGWETSSGGEIWESNTSEVTYIVAPGDRYRIRDVSYQSEDKRLLAFLETIRSASFVKKGDYIDFTQFELEKSRMSVELQNNGYANFSNNYIEITGDSSQMNKDVDIFIDIRSPLPETTHRKYVTGRINVYTDYYKEQAPEDLTADTLQNIRFLRQSNDFLVKTELLNNSIFFRQGLLLRKEDRQKTFRKLNSLGTYRFVTINPSPDPIHDTIMNFDILLTPYQKKWIFDGGMEGYFSTLGAGQLIGISLSGSLQNRNLLGGSEKYTLKAEWGTAVGINPIQQRTRNISIQNNLNLPSFQDFLGLGKLGWKSGLIKDKFYKSFVEESNTNIALGYSALNIIDFYSLSSFNSSFGFDYTSARGHRYIFRPLGFNLDLYTINDSTRFVDNPLIFLSFKDILGTGFVFRDFSFIYNGLKSRKGNSVIIINNFEASGWEVHLANQFYNTLSGKDDVWSIKRSKTDSISFAKYLRYEFDGRFYKEYSKTNSFASRLNFGIIVPFGKNAASPFIRQFGVGGPNSLRAWNIKEPGPGGYRDPLVKLKEQPAIFVNQGDIKIEANIEYRFKILLLLDGALFLDAGNVWTLKDDPERPGAAFSKNFLSQMAVGAGYGLRLNFGFFNIRFDFGYKIRSPFKDPVLKSQWYTIKEIRQQGLGNVQVAVNYPF